MTSDTTTLPITIVLSLTPEAAAKAKDVAQRAMEGRGPLTDKQRDLIHRAMLACTITDYLDPILASIIGAVISGDSPELPDGHSFAARFDPDDLPGQSIIVTIPHFNVAKDATDTLIATSEAAIAGRH